MSQQNIDFGTFPDDPSADAIRTAFQKVQNNFDQLFNTSTASGIVTSVNRTPGAGITVNQPTGDVVLSANIACLQVATSSLKVGRGTDNTQSFVTITSSAQKLNIDINPAQVLSDYFANSTNGMALFNGTLTSSSNAQPNITSVGTLTSLTVSGAAILEGSNTYISDINSFHIPGGSAGQALQTNGSGNLYWGTATYIANGTSNVTIPTTNGNINLSVGGNANVVVATSTGLNVSGTLNATGNANVGNLGAVTGVFTDSVYASNANVTGQLISTIATGTAPLVVNSTTRIANMNVATSGSIANGTSNVSIPAVNGNVNVVSAGNTSLVVTGTGVNVAGTANITGSANIIGNANVGNLGTAGQIISTIATGTAPFVVYSNTTVPNLSVATASLATYATTANAVAGANVSGQVNYAAVANSVAGANVSGQVGNSLVTGTVYTNAQPNITSVGTLTSLTVSGNANVGNLGTAGQIISTIATGTAPFTVSSNTLVPNLNVAHANVSDYGLVNQQTTGIYYPAFVNGSTTGNYTLASNSLISANLANGTMLATTLVGNVFGNITGTFANGTSNISIPVFSSNVNISSAGNANVVVVTGTGANIAGTLNATGNATTGNLSTTTATITTGNITTVNSGLIQNGTSNVTIAAGGNVSTFIGGNTTAQFSVTATASNVAGNLNVTGNATTGNLSTTTATVTTGNITTVNSGLIQNGTSNVTISPSGNVSIASAGTTTFKVTSTGANITGTANITGNLITANANLGNLITANYVNVSSNITASGNISANNLNITGGGNISGINVISATTFQGNLTGGTIANGTSNINIPAINGNVNISSAGNANIFTVTGSGVKVTGVANITGNANVGNLGVTTALSVTGNANVGNLNTAGQIVSTIGTGTAPPFTVSSSARVSNLNVDYANVSDYVNVAAASSGTFYPIFVNDISSANFQPASNSSLSYSVDTGSLSTTLLSVTGNANVGNLGTARVLATSNITAPQIISNIATGTAPFIVTSTTPVANLTVGHANVSDYSNVTTQSTGTYYPTFINGSTTGNYALATQATISANLSNGALIATTFVGNLSGTIGGTFANGTSNVSIPAVNGNVNISSAGNANIVVVTGTSAVVNGYLNVVPKTTPTVVTSPQFTIGEQTANANYQMRLAYINDPTFGYTSAIQSQSAGAAAVLALNPSGGNVGVGTANTSAKVDVLGNARFLATASGSTGAIVLRQNSSDTSGAYIQWTNYASSSQTGYIVVDNTNNMTLGTTNTARIYINSNGNVGVANINPAHTLSVTGTVNISGNANVGNLGTSGNITAGYFIGNGSQLTGVTATVANGTSNVSIPSVNGNVNLVAVGNTTLVVTGTGANIAGTANITGNANVGNLGTSGNITAGYFIGNGSQLTGVTSSGIANGTSNISIPLVNDAVYIYSGGNGTLSVNSTYAQVYGNVLVNGFTNRSLSAYTVSSLTISGGTQITTEMCLVNSAVNNGVILLPPSTSSSVAPFGPLITVMNVTANSIYVATPGGTGTVNGSVDYTLGSHTSAQFAGIGSNTWYLVSSVAN